jgi:hypothetical protein
MEDPVIRATYALVLVTALLVLATAIPAIQRIIEDRALRRARGARLVPDMNILKSRLEGSLNRWLKVQDVDDELVKRLHQDAETNMKLVHQIVQGSYDVSLKFANEIYVLRHFITCLDDEAHRFRDSLNDTSEDARRQRDRRVERVRVIYKSAGLTLQAAESLLPKRATQIDQKTFWDRFSSVVDQRENIAAKDLIDLQTKRGSAQ